MKPGLVQRRIDVREQSERTGEVRAQLFLQEHGGAPHLRLDCPDRHTCALGDLVVAQLIPPAKEEDLATSCRELFERARGSILELALQIEIRWTLGGGGLFAGYLLDPCFHNPPMAQ